MTEEKQHFENDIEFLRHELESRGFPSATLDMQEEFAERVAKDWVYTRSEFRSRMNIFKFMYLI